MLFSFNRKMAALLLTVLIAAAPPACAQQKLLTIQNLIDSAVSHYPLLLQKQLLVKSAEAAETDLQSDYLPRVIVAEQLSAGSANGIRGAYMPFSAAAAVSAVIRDDNKYDLATGNFTSVYSDYTVTDFGYRSARKKSLQASTGLRKADFDKDVYLLKLDICRTYFNILKKRNQLKADLQNRIRYQDIYKVIYAITESGITAGVDSSLAKAEVSKAVITYNQTALSLQQLYADLSLQTGIQSNKIALDSFTQVFKEKPLEEDALVGNADSNANPLLHIYQQSKLLAQQNQQVIAKSYLPKVTAGISLMARGSSIKGQDDYKAVFYGFGYQRFNYVAGIGISYDLFNNLRKKRKLSIGQYELQSMDAAYALQKNILLNVAAKADMAAQNAKATLDELPLQANAAERVYQQKLAQYKAGIADLVDLTNASFVVYRSRTDYIQALGDWYRSTLERAAANGQLDSFIQSIR